MRHHYKITKRYGQRGHETSLPERFTNLQDAKIFVNNKLADDMALNVNSTYRIYEDDEFHSDIDASNAEPIKPQEESNHSSSGQGRGASFSPTPLNTSPRPPGTPPNWQKDEDEEDKTK